MTTDVNACIGANINFTNTAKSEIICANSDSDSLTYSTSCMDATFYIEPKDDNSRIFIDIGSRAETSFNHIHINYNNDQPFTNDYIIENKTDLAIINKNIPFTPTIYPPLPIYPITIICRTGNACRGSDITVSSLNYFKLYCLSDNSCKQTSIDFISFDNDNRGELEIICDGSGSCLKSQINAITTSQFGM